MGTDTAPTKKGIKEKREKERKTMSWIAESASLPPTAKTPAR
jgi:hypothetical protein